MQDRCRHCRQAYGGCLIVDGRVVVVVVVALLTHVAVVVIVHAVLATSLMQEGWWWWWWWLCRRPGDRGLVVDADSSVVMWLRH